jgi:hypothetical protein
MFSLLFVALLSLSLGQLVNPADYANTMQAMPKYQLYWNVDADSVQVGIVVETLGWVGLGIGTQMTGADIWYATTTVTDRQGTGQALPGMDAQQDLTGTSVERTGTHTHVKFSRLLVSTDPTDLPIRQGVQTYICAYHTALDDAFHGSFFSVFNAQLGGAPVATISLENTALVPSQSAQTVGTTVRFVNAGGVTQRLTCPTCPLQIDSGLIAPGATFSHLFDVQGVFLMESSNGASVRLTIGAPGPSPVIPSTSTR